MKIPESVRINGVDYDVQFESRLNDGVNLLLGQVDYDRCIIKLNPDVQAHQKNCVTLWHEILHALCYNADLKLPDEQEEQIVSALAKGIYQVLQDNGRKLFDIAKEDTVP